MAKADFSGRVRPDACPGALQVHTAADGELARIRLPGGAVTAAQLRELAACAEEFGSGVIELTSRANVQVRGLRSAPAFAARMADAGLLPSATHERVRNIVASPLAGRTAGSLVDVRPLVTALDAELCARARLAELPGRFLFAFDDGTGEVAGLGADVTFLGGTGARGVLLLAGTDTGLDVAVDDAVALMIAAATAFLDERAAQDTTAWRIAEIEDGPRRIAARLPGVAKPYALAPVLRGSRAGTVRQRDGRVALEVLIPLGRLRAAQARALADAACVQGEPPREVRLSPWRTVVVPDLTPDQALHWADVLTQAGLVAAPASPWEGLTACTGRPGCARSLADVQADAAGWARTPPARDPGTGGLSASRPGEREGRPTAQGWSRTPPAWDQVPGGLSASRPGGREGRPTAQIEGRDRAEGEARPASQAGEGDRAEGSVDGRGAEGAARSASRVGEDGRAGGAVDGRAVSPVYPAEGDGAEGGGPVPLRSRGERLPVHWSGCERRCGRPRGRVVDVVATGDGYRIELDGGSRACVDASETAATVAAAREET